MSSNRKQAAFMGAWDAGIDEIYKQRSTDWEIPMSIEGNIEERRVFIATCSVMEACEGEHELDGPTVKDAAKEMIKAGWLDNLIVEDCEHLGCPACVEWLKENAECFEELDERITAR